MPAARLTRRSFFLEAAALAQRRRFNVLFLAIDDLRPKLGCYGDRFAQTPHIDAIAARGVTFERAYCQQAVCGPSRASLLTGLRPDTIKVYDLKTSFRATVPDALTLPQLFKQHGYIIESTGKVFHSHPAMLDPQSWSAPERLSLFDSMRDLYALERNKAPKGAPEKTAATECADVPDEAYIDGRVAADAIRTLHRLRDKAFFLAVGFRKPHLPFAAPRRFWDLYDRSRVPLAPNNTRPAGMPPIALAKYQELRSYADIPAEGPIPEAKMREAIHGYYAALSFSDANVGKLLSELDALGLRDNTIIALWGDHGWHLGEQDYWGKTTNFEVCVRAPLIVSVAGMRTAGQHSRALVEFVDLYPTLTELCGLELPNSLEGASFRPLLENPSRAWKAAAFSQYPRGRVMGYSLRTNTHRYTEWLGADGTLAGAELYDHVNDPGETVNTAHRTENRNLVAALHASLKAGWRGALPK
jgi:iduronate 2-sulfatase